MNGFLLLFTVPLVIALCSYITSVVVGGRFRITLKEFCLQVAIITLIMTAGYFIARYQSTADLEVWNAQVAEKKKERVSCEHSYPCNCRPVSCGKNCTTTICDTCYEHLFDVSWYVYTTAGERFEIDRVNRQGTQEPHRWSVVKIGDPTALTHNYTNYIKANPASLFNRKKEQRSYLIPTYPIKSYDYHYIDRFVHDVPIPNEREWNSSLQNLNAQLGVKKQVNVIIVVTKEGIDFSHELENAWLGGKKNDVIIAIGSKDADTIDWVRVISWSHSELMKVEIRDELMGIGTLKDRDKIIAKIQEHVETGFVRMEMKDYEYLMASVSPSPLATWILLIIGIVLSLGTSWYFYQEDVFNERYSY